MLFLQDEEEIPIWIGKEPRFISGINATTTCKDIIQALIDDELANGKYVGRHTNNRSNKILLIIK